MPPHSELLRPSSVERIAIRMEGGRGEGVELPGIAEHHGRIGAERSLAVDAQAHQGVADRRVTPLLQRINLLPREADDGLAIVIFAVINRVRPSPDLVRPVFRTEDAD